MIEDIFSLCFGYPDGGVLMFGGCLGAGCRLRGGMLSLLRAHVQAYMLSGVCDVRPWPKPAGGMQQSASAVPNVCLFLPLPLHPPLPFRLQGTWRCPPRRTPCTRRSSTTCTSITTTSRCARVGCSMHVYAHVFAGVCVCLRACVRGRVCACMQYTALRLGVAIACVRCGLQPKNGRSTAPIRPSSGVPVPCASQPLPRSLTASQ